MAVLALAALLCLAALAPGAAGAATGSISGTVTDASTEEALEGVEVCAWVLSLEEEGEEEFWVRCEESGSDGTYALPNLPAGEYEVEFWAGGHYAIQFYDGKANWWEADPVVVGSGATTGIDAAMVPSAGISGTVTRSSDEEPVEEVAVCAWKAVTEEFGGCDWTREDGTYAIYELEPGEYNVEFWTGETGQNLAFQFYDHKDRWVEADVVTVEPEEVTSGIDAELDPGATISGTVTSAATGLGLDEIFVCSIDAPSGLLMTCTWTEWDGSYALSLLPKGQYKVVFSVDLNEWFEEEIFEEMDDGFLTEFWNNQSSLAAANTVSVGVGDSVSGIDASLNSPAPILPPGTPPVLTPPGAGPAVGPAKPHRKRCKKGFRKKKVKGKVRCVKRRKHRRHRHHAGASATRGAAAAAAPRPAFRFTR